MVRAPDFRLTSRSASGASRFQKVVPSPSRRRVTCGCDVGGSRDGARRDARYFDLDA